MAPVLRPRAAQRHRGLLRVAAAVAAAPLVVTALTSGWRVRGPPAPLAAAESIVFVGLPGISRCPPGSSRIALAAGYDAVPGGRPVLDGEAPPVDGGEGTKLKPGQETVEMQYDRVAKRTRWLQQLKGKFVPYGPKPWDTPRFQKVCIQVQLDSKQAANTKIVNQVTEELRRVSGKHPVMLKAKKNVASLGQRKGYPCGAMVTLYGAKMYDFLNRLNTLVLPRIRDFEGLYPTSVDKVGNFAMGFESQESFKELDELVDTRELVHGFDVNIVTSCMTQPDALKLMKGFGFPFGDPRPPKPPKQPEWMRNMKGKDKKKKR